jgi:hypothetical protein
MKLCKIDGCEREAKARGMCPMHRGRLDRYGDPMKFKHIRNDNVARFWSKVIKTPDCWLWSGQPGNDGYGYIGVDGKNVGAHRYSFYLEHGYWPEPACLHSCDTPLCVNPAHLRQGTIQDNAADRLERDRQLRGSNHPNAKLIESDVLTIRSFTDRRTADLAKQFNVTSGTIRRIQTGKAWGHI